MTYQDWKTKLSELTATVKEAEKAYRQAGEAVNDFLSETMGAAPGETASLEGTIEMISRIVEMKAADAG